MIAGYDRYVQVARCFRDEDLRADRQPEFTQLDLEMSFVDADDVIGMIDGLMAEAGQGSSRTSTCTLPLPRMTYDEAMERFGHDAPDLRFGMEIVDCTDLAAKSEFRVFKAVAEAGGFVRGDQRQEAAPSSTPAAGIDELTEFVEELRRQGPGLVPGASDDGTLDFADRQELLADELLARNSPSGWTAEPGDLLLFVADSGKSPARRCTPCGRKSAAELKLYDPRQMHFSWVVEFPMFEFDDEEKGRWVAMHHPFTAPRRQDIDAAGERSRRSAAPRPTTW